MPENKFDLNKALQAAKLYTPIDYRVQVPQLNTMRNFENWRTDQGYKTGEEKQKEFEDNIKAMQERTVGLSDADSATDWYHAMETNPVKRAEWDRQAAAVTGHGIGAIATIASAGTMGWIPSLISTGTGYAGGYGGYKLGEAIDNRYGTNTAPWLSLIGGLTGGMGGYKGLIKAGNAGLLGTSPYTHLLNGRQNLAYGSQFTKNLVDDIATTSLRKYIPTYGTVKYYGPTMGKTTAAKSNPNLVDFDDYVRPELEQLASELGMTRQQLMMSQDPTVREKARQLMLKSVDGWKKNASNDGKTLVISKSDILQDPIFDNQPLVLQRDEFLKRNAARGETDIQNSLDWYASTRRKGEGKLMEWPDSEGVYISELEPFTPDPHHITFAPQPSKKGSYAFFERPSTYFKGTAYAGTPGTYAGKEVPTWQLPKGQRNQPVKIKDYEETLINDFFDSKPSQLSKAPALDNSDLEALSNSQYARKGYQRNMQDLMENTLDRAFSDDVVTFNKTLKDYIATLPDEVNPLFETTISEGIEQPSIAVRGFRNYLLHEGVDAAELSNSELAKFLTHYHKSLSDQATGKLKDVIAWHGSSTWFDTFDLSKTSSNTGNSGALGPGNYFSVTAAPYGRSSVKTAMGNYATKLNNTQPYVISDVLSTPNGKTMQRKGIIPDFISSSMMEKPTMREVFKQQLKNIPKNDNRAYLDFMEHPMGDWDFKSPAAIMLRRNTGIKSIYPHPSRFIRNADGTVTLIPTNWSDARVNFKQGGTLKAQQVSFHLKKYNYGNK